MELLSGEDMSKLRDRTRQHSGHIALPVAINLARQILNCIKNLNELGYIHRCFYY
jgi:serine/threonine protein kinase